MTIVIDIKGIANIDQKLDEIVSVVQSKKLLSEIGSFELNKIKTRTLQGKDANGNDFDPYTDQYAKYREKAGYSTEPVDLFLTGSMSASMTFDTSGNQVELYFLNTTDKTGARNPLKAFFLNQDRTFFALSKEDIKQIKKIVQDFIKGILQ